MSRYNPRRNFLLAVDYYKVTHHLQIPKGTEIIYSYGESRGGKYPTTKSLGIQPFVMEYLEGVVVEPWMLDEAEAFFKQGFGFDYFNRAGWQHIIDVHGGRLPLRIRAVKEGTVVPTGNALFTIENTDPAVPWLTNYVETMLLRGVWYPTTVCTHSYHMYQLIKRWCDKSGCEISPFHLNDFGARGVSSGESAMLGGMAHLAAGWLGTDTIEGILGAKRYFDAGVCGYSVFASEHSTTTIHGRGHEVDAVDTFLNNLPDEATGSFVADSEDTENFVRNILGGHFKDRILARKGKIVARPDSGDPVEMSLKVTQWLWDAFGGTTNTAGFKVLNPRVGVIYGDSINYENADKILEHLVHAGFAASNVIFGSGGGLLQKVDRDTQRFAVKCSAARINGKWVDVFKDPVTDSGKRSKKGRLALSHYGANEWTTTREELVLPADNMLELVFENGELLRHQTFDDVRARS